MSRRRNRVQQAGEAYYSSSQRLPRLNSFNAPQALIEELSSELIQLPSTSRFGAVTVTPVFREGRRAEPAFPSHRLSFEVPAEVKVCHQRRVRREVLFARRKAGFSGSAKKRHWYRSEDSQWRC